MIKSALMTKVRAVRDWAAGRGLSVRTVRGREHWRAGFELLWHDFDQATERVAISTVRGFGTNLLFLVRNKDDWIQGHHLRGVFYSEDELRVIARHFEGGTFLDIGANVGNHSLFAASVLGAKRVIACEPNPNAYRILRCNIALNDLGEVIEHVSVGLSDKAGSATPEEPEHGMNLGGTRLVEGGGPLQLQRGDDLFGSEDIAFVKIDVEGLEMPVLEGLGQTLSRCRPKMLVEVNDVNREAFEAYCTETGYRIAEEMRPYPTQANLIVVPG